jgi:transglutaminase-like putative cysteine protease
VPDLRRRLVAPREGWTSAVLLGIMVLALAWSAQGAEWLPQLEFLVPVAAYAVIAGAIIGLLPLSVVVTLPLGALIGAGVVLWAIGGEYFPALDQGARLIALRDELAEWTLIVLRTGYPPQLTPYAIAFGVVMWTTGFVAAHAVYRHHRVLDAIVVVGIVLVANMSATRLDLFAQLLVFVCAALLLWLRSAAIERRESWQRRRVNETLDVPAAAMRTGVAFAAASVILAWTLTTVAVAAPLTDAWRGLDVVWTGVRDSMEGVVGQLTNPHARLGGTSFSNQFTVVGSWVSNDEEVLLVAATRPVYLRTATYDVYTGRGWERADATRRSVPSADRLFPGETPERPSVGEAFEPEIITIEVLEPLGRNLFTAGYPIRVYAPSVVLETSGQPVLGGIEAANPFGSGEAYQVEVLHSRATEAQLAEAGTEYPEVVSAMYLDTSRVTDRVRGLAQQVVQDAGADNPYAQARALSRYLSRDPSFTYQTEAPVPSGSQDLVDFFLNEGGRTGYCQYYASAMAMMARSLGIPARVGVGFAPGEETEDGPYLVRQASAHAWAELYFPGYGWQIFEATKTIDPGFVRPSGVAGSGQQLPTGVDPISDVQQFEIQGPRDPRTISNLPGRTPDLIEGGVDPLADPAATDGAREGNALVITLILLAAVGFIAWQARRIRRRWRLLPAGDRTWQRLTLAADRAGVAPRPSETIYEYAGWLEEQIPRRRPEIRLIADGKVWQSYSGRRMSLNAAGRLEAAWRRLRLPLVLLTVRHWLRGLFRRS